MNIKRKEHAYFAVHKFTLNLALVKLASKKSKNNNKKSYKKPEKEKTWKRQVQSSILSVATPETSQWQQQQQQHNNCPQSMRTHGERNDRQLGSWAVDYKGEIAKVHVEWWKLAQFRTRCENFY